MRAFDYMDLEPDAPESSVQQQKVSRWRIY